MKFPPLLKITIAMLFIFAGTAQSQTTIYGGRGLLRVHSAETIGRGRLYVNSFLATYLQAVKTSSTLGKDHTFSVGITYGLNRYFEMSALLVPYQDDQKTIWGPPGDTRLGLKFQTPFSGRSLISAVRMFVNLPTAKYSNVPFEPYSSGKVGIGAQLIMTADMTDSFPLFPLKAHLNLGFFDQNIRDQLFIDEEDQYIIGAGIKFPVRSSVVYTEYTAEIFSNNPVVTAYSLNSQRVTQGLKFLGPWGLIFDFAVDISLSQKPPANSNSDFIKQYADWKVIFGFNYPMRLKWGESRDERLARQAREKNKSRAVQEVHEKRQYIEDDLKKMEESLQGKKKKEQDDQKQLP
ncbi:MAG TPA: hypothetical protein ENJ29_03055 [Bacteroidetes bacterium]|nr:hypothetical protein [Bacteroidota bacterium]